MVLHPISCRGAEMPSYYDDNFGWYEIESEEDVEFYHSMQRKSVEKKCDGCGRKVKLAPDYGYCNSCATKLERGQDLEF
jgi:rRNA maturation endonuclease Nob1